MKLEDRVIAWLAQQEAQSYLVGGCVRDRLLKRRTYDLDVATTGDGLSMARHLANHFGGDYYPLDTERSTGRAILYREGEARLVVDVARLRGSDLASDLADRDFTINALAMDFRSLGTIIDHHGGCSDLEACLIRPVSDASIRSDPVRALRGVRLAAQLNFRLAPETENLIRRDGAALSEVSGERVRDELAHLLKLACAGPYLNRLDELGLLTIVLPELEPLRDLPQPPPHYLNGLAHSLETVCTLEVLLDEVLGVRGKGHGSDCREEKAPGAGPPDSRTFGPLVPYSERLESHFGQTMSDARPRVVVLKLAALLHDTGKPGTRTQGEDGQIHFIGHEQKGAKIAAEALRRLRFSQPEVRLAETIVCHHMRPLLLAKQGTVSSRAVYRFFRDTGEAGVDVLLHALADHWATYPPDREDDQGERLAALTARMLEDCWQHHAERVEPPVLVDGHDLMREFGLPPGPQIGDLLETVREAQVSGQVRTRDEAFILIRSALADKA